MTTGYFFGLHVFGMICLVPWIHTTNSKYKDYLVSQGQDKTWWYVGDPSQNLIKLTDTTMQGLLLCPNYGRQSRLYPHTRQYDHLPRRNLAHASYVLSRLRRQHILPLLSAPPHLDHLQALTRCLVPRRIAPLPARPPATMLHPPLPQHPDLDARDNPPRA